MSQTSYNMSMAVAFAGLLADLTPHSIESFMAENAIPFGCAVVKGTAVDQVKLPTVTGAVFRGIAVHTHAIPQPATPVGYPVSQPVGVLRKGRIWVPVSAAVAVDATPYFNFTTGIFSSSNTGSDAVPTGIFRTATTGAGIAILEINLP